MPLKGLPGCKGRGDALHNIVLDIEQAMCVPKGSRESVVRQAGGSAKRVSARETKGFGARGDVGVTQSGRQGIIYG